MIKKILQKFRNKPAALSAAHSSVGLLDTAVEPRFPKSFSFKEQLLTKNHLGLVLDKKELLVAHLHLSQDKIFVDLLAKLPASKEAPMARVSQYIAPKAMQKACVTAVFPSLQTLSRPLDLNDVPAKEFEAVLRFQMEPHLPYPLTDAILTSCIVAKKGPLNKVQVYCVQKEDVKAHLEDLQALDINPEIVTPKAAALALFGEAFLPQAPARILIDISREETSCLLLANGLPLAMRTLAVSLQGPADADDHLQNYAREISRILFSFEQLYPGASLLPITFTGIEERDPLVLSLLAKLLGHASEQPVQAPKNIVLHDAISIEECAAFATAIGAALVKSPFHQLNSKLFLNLRTEELSYLPKWRRWKKDFALYFSMLFLTILASVFISSALDREPLRVIQEQYGAYVAQFGKTHSEIEKEFSQANQESEKALDLLSLQDIQGRLAFVEKQYLLPGEVFPLHPDVPLVSDTLAWLKEIPECAGMKLDSFSYQLKRPDKEHPKERYQVRLNLLFTMPTPEAAKELREALLRGNRFVDPSQDLAWSVEKGRYKASFVLKDRTAYP